MCTLQGIVSTFDGYEKALKMVQKNLIIFLALLWIMPPLIAKRSVIPQFQKMNNVNYREEDEIVNSPQSCISLECSKYQTSRDGEIDIIRQKRDTGIQYRHEKKEDVTGFILNQLPDPNMEQYISIRVCYCKIYIADTYI